MVSSKKLTETSPPSYRVLAPLFRTRRFCNAGRKSCQNIGDEEKGLRVLECGGYFSTIVMDGSVGANQRTRNMANNGQATKQESGWKDFKNRSIRVLLVEDSENDALLLLRHLQKGGYEPISQRVETAAAMLAALEQQSWDIIISDYVVPGFGGLEALALLQNKGLDLPFIIVSGHIGEEVAVEAMKAGAHDYVMKDNLRRLVPAVERELREAEIRCQRKKAEQQLKSTAQELGWTVEELRKTEEQLRARN